jgi:hypothetical protein
MSHPESNGSRLKVLEKKRDWRAPATLCETSPASSSIDRSPWASSRRSPPDGRQQTPDGYSNLERMLAAAIRRGAHVGLCGSCMDARAIRDDTSSRAPSKTPTGGTTSRRIELEGSKGRRSMGCVARPDAFGLLSATEDIKERSTTRPYGRDDDRARRNVPRAVAEGAASAA